MDALFIVPTLVSPNCNARMIPALAKVIERNIIIQNSALFRDAALLRYENSVIANVRGSARRALRNTVRTGKRFIGLESTYILSNINLEESSIYTDFLLESSAPLHQKDMKFSDKYHSDDIEHKRALEDEYEKLVRSTRGLSTDIQNAYQTLEQNPNIRHRKKKYDDLVNLYNTQADRISKLSKELEKTDSKIKAVEISKIEEEKKEEADKRKQADDAWTKLQNQKSKEESDKKAERDRRESLQNQLRTIDKELRDEKRNIDTAKRARRAERIAARSKSREEEKESEIQKALSKTSSAETQYAPKRQFTSIDQIEQPIGITFFNQVSLEPTILEIPINYNPAGYAETKSTVLVKIGVKCVPYTVDGISNILNLLNETNKMNAIERFFINVWRRWESRLPFTKKRAAKKGNYFNPDEGRFMIKYSPNFDELNNPQQIAKELKSSKTNSPWSTMIMLSSLDFESEDDLKNIVRNYGKLSKFVFGDVVITNDTNESVYFCTPKYRNCQELQYSYLQKIMNLDNIIDYSTLARQQNPWQSEARPRRARMDKAIKESIVYNNNKGFKKKAIKEMYLTLLEEDCPECLKNLKKKI